MSDRRERLDVLVVDRGLAANRTRARALIMAGRVRSGGQRLDKPGARFPADTPIELDPGPRYVSRGAHKLEAALAEFGIDPSGRLALDIGASTGGFTQVLLERGAERVIALDVGRGQLDWSLRNDPRVTMMEGVNARHLAPTDLPFSPGLVVMDVSFISITRILPAVRHCLASRGEVVTLVKPHFEAGRGKVVNVASDAARVGSSGETVYAGAKGGIIAFTKSLARELARIPIHANCVCPGPTDTPLFASLPEKLRGSLERAIPFRRLARPEEVAQAILYLAGRRSDYVTGQTLSVSGGLTMAG